MISLKYELVIPPRLVDKLNRIASSCLREIRDEKTGSSSVFFQLIAEMALPRFGAGTTGWTTEMQCPTCKRDGYFNIPQMPLMLVYDQPILAFSVAETYEGFGNSRLRPKFMDSNFAVPYLVVNEAVKEVLSGESGIEFVPMKMNVCKAQSEKS